ncbi:ficolin-1-like [Pomacea canaliculata]|uniref:ficolin-1-like n=1 Tax=Pomacea canaliculata TaxID=400727 RepID=UPI000D7270B4|nr:ficolin-1-like [Pomacea canaliculata]
MVVNMLTTMILPFILFSTAFCLEAQKTGSVPKAQVMLQLEGMDYSLFGYNSLKGCPLTSGRDPGFTLPIFSACSPAHLHNTFMEYPESGLRGHSMVARDGVSLQTCSDLCVSNRGCLSFDFRVTGGRCLLHDVTACDAQSGWYPHISTGWTHYQRSCLQPPASYPGPEWYNAPCKRHVECPEPNSRCVSGRCVCIDGLVYMETDSSCGAAESCRDLQTAGGKSGVYSIELPETREKLRVWCDMDSGNGGWLVFQRRRDGSVDFYRNWTQYEQGFGDITGEFWLGLSRLHTLSKGRPTRLRVDLGEVDGHRHYAEYTTFRVDGPETNYTLTVSGYSGNAGDSLQYHNNQSFSTFDRDNDKWSDGNCAVAIHGAWWYKICHETNLNGRYKVDGADGTDGVNWFFTHYDRRSFTFSEMKVQPV